MSFMRNDRIEPRSPTVTATIDEGDEGYDERVGVVFCFQEGKTEASASRHGVYSIGGALRQWARVTERPTHPLILQAWEAHLALKAAHRDDEEQAA